ncbi:MAG TPA: hypothetical protein VNK46_12340 [Nitrospiraceae bacterium]|nr:hypothetical protein [Nitrospiraceae bacterium]
MAWRVYRVAYELRSPLHVGYHKIGNVQRTRYYVPARNIWGAITEKLTRAGFTASGVAEGDYVAIGEWVRQHCAFSYWFFHAGEQLLFPSFQTTGVLYGHLTESVFTQRYLSAHVTTALDAATTSAELGSLHEIEIIVPNEGDDAHRLTLAGWIFLDDIAVCALGDESKWGRWLGDLQMGGERRYGFGQVRLGKNGWQPQSDGRIFDRDKVRLGEDRPQVQVTQGQPFLAHTLAQGVCASGAIEPLIGRETVRSDRFGGRLTGAQMCWIPGSICETTLWLEFTPGGTWKKAAV